MNEASFVSQEYFDLITEQEAKFILDHAEKQLKDILDTNLLIVSRSTTLLTLAVGLIVGLSGFCINRHETLHKWDELSFCAGWGALYIFIIAIIIAQNFIPKSYLIPGAEPKDFFIDNVFNKKNAEYRLIAIYVNEIVQTQVKINYNKNTNDKRWHLFNISLFIIAATPLVFAGIYWLSTCLF